MDNARMARVFPLSGLSRLAARYPVALVWLAFAAMLCCHALIFKPFFPLPGGRFGDDYAISVTTWLDGNFWFHRNTFAVPWFSPSFCAGQPFFADPQSAYYSLPQLLTIIVGPVDAAFLTLMISTSLLFWGGYLLGRKVFALKRTYAVLVGGLLMFNGFLPHRMIVGHAIYHGFALVPWIAVLLLVPLQKRSSQLAAAIGAGVLLAYWVQSGFSTMILAGGLAVFILALLHCVDRSALGGFLSRSALACLCALGLSAAKLVAAFSFIAHFPRTDYLLPGAENLPDALVIVATCLFLPSQWAYSLGHLANMQWPERPHEWAYGFGVGAGLLLFALVYGRLARLRHAGIGKLPRSPRLWALWALLALALLWPLAFNIYTPSWNAFLKTLPVLNTTSTPLRWLMVYIPFVAVVIGLLLQRTGWRYARLVAVGCLFCTVAQSAWEPREFYRAQAYDARPATLAAQELRAGRFEPVIWGLGRNAELATGGAVLPLQGNNTFIGGTSQIACYNPVFGYVGEKFSDKGLVAGPVVTQSDGFLNLKNPACYVFPKENNCQPGDRFRQEQLEQVKAFVAYHPYAFEVSHAQKVASIVTECSLMLVAAAIFAWLALGIVNWQRGRR